MLISVGNENSLRHVFTLRLPGEPEDWPEEDHKQYLRSLIDTTQDSMVNALARLLKYLTTNLAWLCLSHQQNPIVGIRNLCMLVSLTYCYLFLSSHSCNVSLNFYLFYLLLSIWYSDKQVWINQETYRALQVFTHTAHPSLFKWTSGAYKEGLSIFGLFNRCHSKLGSKYMR